MIDVVVVSVEKLKKEFFLSPNSLKLNVGDIVIFENNHGLYCGKVIRGNYKEKRESLSLPLQSVLRVASDGDLRKVRRNDRIASRAIVDAKNMSKNLGLEMNFIDSYFNFDNSQLLFTFMSDGRVDFRELVKVLAKKYRTRIELRQIGVRDKAKRVGGIGPCGLMLCCNQFLNDFNSVSINMAKNQMLALNPSKINGICGRLLCCLGYEDDVYTELKRGLPNIGDLVTTDFGCGNVVDIDIFKRSFSIDLGDGNIIKIAGENYKDGSIK